MPSSPFVWYVMPYPPGSAEPDSALVMRRVPVDWNALPSLVAG